MANGTTDEKLARADRIAEQSAKAQHAAEQHSKATRNAVANLRAGAAQLPPYRDEMDSEAELTAPGVKFRATRLPRPALLALGFALAVLVLALAWRLAHG